MRGPGTRKAAYSGVSNPDERSATAPDRAAELHAQHEQSCLILRMQENGTYIYPGMLRSDPVSKYQVELYL